MLILPTDDKVKARKLLDEAVQDKFKITMLVFGDGQGEDQIASKADVRAQALPSTRRVVWVRDTSVLTTDETRDYRNNDNDIVVCTLSLDDTSVVQLSRSLANSFLELERAFAKAQQA